MQELKKILEEIDETIERYGKNPYIDEKVTDLCYGMKITKDIIRKHMNDGWIPVKEWLPPPHVEVWVTVKRNGKLFVSTDIVMGNNFWDYDTKNVLAWKEKDLMPEPYRPERTERSEEE